MKKALLALLIVVVSISAVFAGFNYGIDVTGIYDTTLTDDSNQTLLMRFKPYVSGDNYKVQLRADWKVNDGFKHLKEHAHDDYFDVAAAFTSFIETAYLDITENMSIGIARKLDVPYFYFTSEDSMVDFSFKLTDLNLPRVEGFKHSVPMEADLSVTLSEKFPVKLNVGIDAECDINEFSDFQTLFSPEIGFTLPFAINNHDFTFDFAMATSAKQTYKDGDSKFSNDLFKDWVYTGVLETSFGGWTIDGSTILEKETGNRGVLTLALDTEYEYNLLDVTFGASVPFATADNWGVITTEDGHSKDSVYATVSYGKKYFAGASLEVNSLMKALSEGVELEDLYEPSKKYLELSAFVGFDTDFFDLRLDTELTDVKKLNAKTTLTFTVNAENFLSK